MTMGFWGDTKNWLFGGNATKGLDATGANTGYAQGYLRDQLGGVMGRAAPQAQAAQLGQAAQLAGGPQDQVRAQQMQTAGYLQNVLGGQMRGAGELAVNRQVGQGLAAQQAAMRAARGANAALAARNAMRNSADIGLAGAGQAAQAQLADQQAAAGQLGSLLGQTREGDLTFADRNAQLQQQRMLQQGQFQQQAGLANQNARLQQTGMNDAASQAAMAQLLGMDQATYQRELQKRQLAASDKGALPGILQAGGSILGTYATGGFGGGKLFDNKPAAAGPQMLGTPTMWNPAAAPAPVPAAAPAPVPAAAPGNTGFGGYLQSWVPQGFTQ